MVRGCRKEVSTHPDMSPCNQQVLREALREVQPDLIVEIGVGSRLANSSTGVWIKEKPRLCYYIGMDKDNRSGFQNPTSRVFMLKGDSGDIQPFQELIDRLKIKPVIDILFIDGHHSVSQCIKDWEYTRYLSAEGVVILHDTNYHPGPRALLEAVDPSRFRVDRRCSNKDDWGITVLHQV